jgi:hypothetical protein
MVVGSRLASPPTTNHHASSAGSQSDDDYIPTEKATEPVRASPSAVCAGRLRPLQLKRVEAHPEPFAVGDDAGEEMARAADELRLDLC